MLAVTTVYTIKATSYLWHPIFSFVSLQKEISNSARMNVLITLASVDYFVVISEVAQSFKNL